MKKKKGIVLAIFVLAIIIVITFGATFAKYIHNSFLDYYFKSKGFYFSSDYLDTTKVKNVNNLWDGKSVYFNVRNNLNQEVITNYDISYKATCKIINDASSFAECHMNGSENGTYEGVLSHYQVCNNETDDGVDVSLLTKTECELNGYEWINQIASKELYFDIITNDNHQLKDVVVEVSVISTSPYRKTLTGEFVLHRSEVGDNNINLKYNNYSNYDRLIISNSYSTNKCVTISWDANKLLIADDLDSINSFNTDENGYINEINFNIESRKEKSFIFYKRDFNNIYDAEEFSMEYDDC